MTSSWFFLPTLNYDARSTTHQTHFCICFYTYGHTWWCVWWLDVMEIVLWKEPLLVINTGGDSVVGIATCYGLDGPGIECRWGARFSTPVQSDPGTYPASYTMGTGSPFPGVKRPGHGIDQPPASTVEVIERVELYLYSPSGPLWPVLGWTVPFTFTFTSDQLSRLCVYAHIEPICLILWTWSLLVSAGSLSLRNIWF